MQRFTLFSLILSVSVVLIIGDMVLHGYLSNNSNVEPSLPDVESGVLDESNSNEQKQTLIESNLVTLESEPELMITNDLFVMAGFLTPTLKDTTFSGLVFQFIPFAGDAGSTVNQWNLFDGENYVGSMYEIKYVTDTGAFQGYLTLRDDATGLINLGAVNEANNYGEASFYFNHKTKVKTVHMVMRSGKDIFAFEYAQSYHEKMKKVFDIL